METYIIIHNLYGDTMVESMDKKTLIERIKENYWGNVDYLSEMPEPDTNYWGDSVLIIKGEVVIPEPIEKVVEYDIK